MCSITDHLFNHPDDYLETLDELHTKMNAVKDITVDKHQEKMYS